MEPVADLFGEGSFAISGDMAGDTVLAVAAFDIERWMDELDRTTLPPTAIWVGTPPS